MKKFTVVERGYNIEEVSKFLDDVIFQTENMLNKMKEQQQEIENLNSQLVNFKKTEDELKNALFKAEQTSTDIRKAAYEERNSIVEDARKNASRIINDALLRAEKIEIKADVLERNMRIFKRKLKLVVEQQLAVIEEIDEIELK